MADNSRDGAFIAANDGVNVLRHDSQRVKNVAAFLARLLKAHCGSKSLRSCQNYGRIFPSLLGCQAHLLVMGVARERPAARGGRCRTKAEQFPVRHEVGPRASRVVWKPESVGSEDNV